jgi:hypothetical protein
MVCLMVSLLDVRSILSNDPEHHLLERQFQVTEFLSLAPIKAVQQQISQAINVFRDRGPFSQLPHNQTIRKQRIFL